MYNRKVVLSIAIYCNQTSLIVELLLTIEILFGGILVKLNFAIESYSRSGLESCLAWLANLIELNKTSCTSTFI